MYAGSKMSLSDTLLRSINGKPYSGKSELSSRDGLSVRISHAGTITWQYRFRFSSSPARLTLGRYPDVKLAEARKLIPELRNSLANDTDPRVYWKQRNTRRSRSTLSTRLSEAAILPHVTEKCWALS